MTVSDLMDKWLSFAEDTLSPTTFEEYQRLAVRRVVPAFGNVPLTQLTTRQLDDFYQALKNEAGLAASSVRQIHSIIRRCLKQGVKWGLLEHNAAVNATPPPIEPKEVQPPPIDVIRTLVDEATAYDPTFGVLVRLAIVTGLRRSELCGLRWDDTDYATSTMRVRRAVVQTKGATRKKSTKTRATRRITLGDTTVALMQQHQARVTKLAVDNGTEVAAEGYLFSQSLDGSTPMKPYRVTDWFRNLPNNDRKIRFHDLRHAHATQLLGNGIDIPTVATRLGHATPTTTLNTYAHALKQNDQQQPS